MYFQENTYKSYDHRLKILIIKSKNPLLFSSFNIPPSTIASWAQKGVRNNVVSLDLFDEEKQDLILKILTLEKDNQALAAQVELMEKTNEIFEVSRKWHRLPSKEGKEKILNLVNNASKFIPLKKCLKLIDLSITRLKDWKLKAANCFLGDKSSCPKLIPNKATPKELRKMKKLVMSEKYAHFPIWSLAIHAMREGMLFLTPSTWYKYIKVMGWKQPKIRKYFKPKMGIRAFAINEIWHIDITVIKLIDGTKVYVQAVIDNFSRYILAWNVFTQVLGNNTEQLLRSALTNVIKIDPSLFPNLFADSGIENINEFVNKLIHENKLKRTIAQIDINFSNSMIEALFKSFKYNYLYYQELTTVSKLIRQVDFYFNQHNQVLPHNALNGATPEEVFHSLWNEEDILKIKRRQKEQIEERRKTNMALTCEICLAK